MQLERAPTHNAVEHSERLHFELLHLWRDRRGGCLVAGEAVSVQTARRKGSGTDGLDPELGLVLDDGGAGIGGLGWIEEGDGKGVKALGRRQEVGRGGQGTRKAPGH